MPYSTDFLSTSGPLQVVNIFPRGSWRALAIGRLILMSSLRYLFQGILAPLSILLDSLGLWDMTRPLLERVWPLLDESKKTPAILVYISWCLSAMLDDTATFEQNYLQAWQDKLEREGTTHKIYVFVGDNRLHVPILFDKQAPKVGNDQQTFESLRMWYSWMQLKRGFEIILPRQLIRVEQVKLCGAVQGLVGLGSRVKAFELGRHGSGHVANFENPSRISETQRFMSEDMLEDPMKFGLEFVRAWDALSVSIIALAPFVGSLVISAIWIGVSVGVYDTGVQVATQTAFTIASYVVTAGALVIALFAYLDSRAQIR